MKRFLFVAMPLVLLLSACAQATPTIDPAQIQASAVAAASTMIAQTQAAMPTDTPVPPTPLPTDTPLATATLLTLPTLPGFTTPAAGPTTTGDDCNHPMDAGSSGPLAHVVVRNDTKGPVIFGLYLGRKNSFGQCGYLSWSIPKSNSITVGVPYARPNQGDPCYFASAYVNDPKHQSTPVGTELFCLNNSDKWTFDIGYENIKLTPP